MCLFRAVHRDIYVARPAQTSVCVMSVITVRYSFVLHVCETGLFVQEKLGFLCLLVCEVN